MAFGHGSVSKAVCQKHPVNKGTWRALGEVAERLNAAVLKSPAVVPLRHRKHG
jgi:hypothetical protein